MWFTSPVKTLRFNVFKSAMTGWTSCNNVSSTKSVSDSESFTMYSSSLGARRWFKGTMIAPRSAVA